MPLQRTLIPVIAITGQLFAVEPGKPSKTSIWVMAGRAVGARDFDPAVRNPDWLAEQLLGPDERAVLKDDPIIKALDRDYREAVQDVQIHRLVRGVLVRTRFIDERLSRAMNAEGSAQVVILGAGFDTRAYRLRKILQNAKVFEVDYGPTQEYKKSSEDGRIISPTRQSISRAKNWAMCCPKRGTGANARRSSFGKA